MKVVSVLVEVQHTATPLLQKCRALLQRYMALLRIYRALLKVIGVLVHAQLAATHCNTL